MNLQFATSQMTLIVLFILIFIGSFGSLCNIILFTSKELKKSSCAVYFLCTAMFELPILCFGIITRLAMEHFDSTLLNTSRSFCKIRSYLITAMSLIASYFILFACIDRCMATSTLALCRAFSQMKVAYRVAAAVIIISMTINIPVLIFFDLQPACIPQPGVYSLYYSIYLIVFSGIVTNGLTLVFSIWTIKKRLRIAPGSTTNTSQQRRMQKMEGQLVVVSEQFFFSLIK
jgi:hypothetical protein